MFRKEFPLFLFLALAAGVFLSIPLKAQVNDAGLWTSVKVETKIVKKLNASIVQEFRFYENITELGAYYTEAGLDYKINKHFQVEVNYRFTHKRKVENYYSIRHRLGIDLKYSKKIKPFELKYRARFQNQYEDIGRSEDGGVAEFYFRNKLNLQLDLKKAYTPYVSVELYSPLNYPRYYAFNNIRYMAGIEYAITKHHKLDLYYMIHKEVNVSQPITYYVFGIGYIYKL
jgi:ribosomal protein S13